MKYSYDPISEASVIYDNWCASEKEKTRKKNKKNGSKEKAIPEALEVFIHEMIKQLALCGQDMGKNLYDK